MAYLGRDPIHGNSEIQMFAPNGSSTTFALDFPIGSAGSILLVKNGLIQKPSTDYTIINGGTSISITGAPILAGVSLFAIYLSTQYLQNTIPDNSISADKLSSSLRGKFPSDVVVPAAGSTTLTYGVGKFFILGNDLNYSLTLPASPAIGDMFWFNRPAGSTVGAITVTVNTNNQNLSTGQGTITVQNSATATITMTGQSAFTSNDRKTRWFVFLGVIGGTDFGWFEYKIDAF
jgi:hypothetical protein